MAPEILLLTGILALVIGAVIGLFGGGGSILSVPLLLYVTRLEAHAAIAVSLFMVSATSALGALVHARHGHVELRPALRFAVATSTFAFVGGWTAHFFPGWLLLLLFALLMLTAAFRMLRPGEKLDLSGAPPTSLMVILAGTATGFVSGLIGAGGGFIVVPALVFLVGLGMHQAIGTSLLVITFSSAAGFLGHASKVELEPMVMVAVTLPSLVGAFVGSSLARRLSSERLRQGFGLLVLVLGLFMLVQQLRTAFA